MTPESPWFKSSYSQESGSACVEVADLTASGRVIRTLAEGLERSYGFVHRFLTEAGTTLRRPGGA
jgi:hypothetical protein